jgi:hypothetical protein
MPFDNIPYLLWQCRIWTNGRFLYRWILYTCHHIHSGT